MQESTGPVGPVPQGNTPGHHPDHEQDKPDLEDFAAKLGMPQGEAATEEGRTASRSRIVLLLLALAALVAAGVLFARKRNRQEDRSQLSSRFSSSCRRRRP